MQKTLAQQTDASWTNKKAAKWVRDNKWRQGLDLKPHQSTNKLEFAKQYHKNQQGWDKAFRFIKEHKLQDLAPGKYPIDGEMVYASVTEAPGKDMD